MHRHRKYKTNMKDTLRLLFALAVLLSPALAQPPGGAPVISPKPSTEPQSASPDSAAGPHVAPADTPPVDVDPNYVIGPADSIMVNVWKEPTFTESVLVRPDGMISVPALGDVPAAGKTPMQLAADLTTRLKKLIIEPTVTVTVVAINSKRVYLVGEIGHIGPLPMTPDMTVMQAIASAGGLTPFANKKHIYILRGEPGKQTKIAFNYKKALKTGDSQGITLEPGDTIVVP
jgi:polysaccharide export outer membrane protein